MFVSFLSYMNFTYWKEIHIPNLHTKAIPALNNFRHDAGSFFCPVLAFVKKEIRRYLGSDFEENKIDELLSFLLDKIWTKNE